MWGSGAGCRCMVIVLGSGAALQPRVVGQDMTARQLLAQVPVAAAGHFRGEQRKNEPCKNVPGDAPRPRRHTRQARRPTSVIVHEIACEA